MKILMVLTSHDQLGTTGRKTGFWLEELAAPYYVFKDAGNEVVLASPKGGQPPLDPKSNEPAFQTDLTRRFEADEEEGARAVFTRIGIQGLGGDQAAGGGFGVLAEVAAAHRSGARHFLAVQPEFIGVPAEGHCELQAATAAAACRLRQRLRHRWGS